MTFRLKSPRVKLAENDVEKACLDFARLRGWWPIRLHAGTFKSLDGKRYVHGVEKGTPDYILVKQPSFFLETKRPGGDLTPEQRQKIFELEKFYGLETVVVEGVQELIEWLDRHDRSP